MANYKDFGAKDAINLTAAARTKFDDSASKYTMGGDTGFTDFRNNCKKARQTFLAKKAAMNEEIKQLEQAKMYSGNYVNDKYMTMRKEYDASREETLANLRKQLGEVVDTRKAQVEEYTLRTPDSATFALLQTIQMRSSISQTEIEMLIGKCCDNFQALSIVHALAENNGMFFIMPFDPKDFLEGIDLAERWCNAFLDAFDREDKELTYAELEFYGDYTSTKVTSLFEALDNSTVTKDKTEIIDTLKAKAAKAQKDLSDAVAANDMDTARAAAREVNKLNNFIRNNEGVMLDEEEKRRRARQEAAKLVSEVIN